MLQFQDIAQKILIVIGNGQTLAANFPALVGLVPASQVIVLAAGVTTARTSIPHSLGYKPAVTACKALWVGADSDAQASVAVSVTKTDATNITIKASAAQAAAESAYIITIDLDTDVGGRYFANQ